VGLLANKLRIYLSIVFIIAKRVKFEPK